MNQVHKTLPNKRYTISIWFWFHSRYKCWYCSDGADIGLKVPTGVWKQLCNWMMKGNPADNCSTCNSMFAISTDDVALLICLRAKFSTPCRPRIDVSQTWNIRLSGIYVWNASSIPGPVITLELVQQRYRPSAQSSKLFY